MCKSPEKTSRGLKSLPEGSSPHRKETSETIEKAHLCRQKSGIKLPSPQGKETSETIKTAHMCRQKSGIKYEGSPEEIGNFVWKRRRRT
jgi:hypothetical protein